MTGTAAGDCIMFSSADWADRYWTNKQHTALQLTERGWRVLFVDSVGFRAPNVRSGRVWRRILRRLTTGVRDFFLGPREVRPGLWVLSPFSMPFGKSIPVVAAINRFFLDRPIRKFVRRKGFARPMVWTYHPYMLTAAPERGPLVYHCVDDTGAAPGVDKDIFDAAERALLAQADVVFTTSVALQKKCAALNANTRYFPNVADARHFGRAFTIRQLPRDIGAIAGPRLGFHGVLTDFKVDFELLLTVAASRRDWHLVLIGEEREGQANATAAALRREPNVHFLGYRPYAQLPEYLRGFDVGLLPFADNAFTRSIFPMKLHEYLAAGVPVVSTSATYASPQMRHVLVGQTPEAFIAAVEAQLRKGRLTDEEAREALGPNTWGERLTQMLDIVAALPASKR